MSATEVFRRKVASSTNLHHIAQESVRFLVVNVDFSVLEYLIDDRHAGKCENELFADRKLA